MRSEVVIVTFREIDEKYILQLMLSVAKRCKQRLRDLHLKLIVNIENNTKFSLVSVTKKPSNIS